MKMIAVFSANKLIGNYEKDFVTQVESKNMNVNVDLSGLTHEQLEKLIKLLKKEE